MPEIPAPVITTERLILRPVQFGDITAILRATPDPALSETVRRAHTPTWLSTALWVLRAQVARRRGKRMDYVVLKRDTGELVGMWSATKVDLTTHRSAELTAWVEPRFQKEGYYTEAGNQLETHLFVTVGLHRFIGVVDEDNAPMKHILEARGWTHEATLRDYGMRDGKYCTFFQYSLLRTDPGADEVIRRAGHTP